jgi:diguanylate cyclase (GGDEF)-like protein
MKALTEKQLSWIAGSLFLGGLYWASFYNYLLFHSLAEIFSISIAFTIFMLAWNSDKYMENKYLLLLGISYLFIGVLDLLHTLSYKGMGIFVDYDYYANQLWIATRYLESFSLLVAFFLLGHQAVVRKVPVFIGYFTITAVIVASVFYWKCFPVCFVEGAGLTPFKIYSEYIISSILLLTLFIAIRERKKVTPRIFTYFVLSIGATIVSELAFTFYVNNYGLSNMVGHYFKIFSFYFIYRSVVVTCITEPYDIIFHELKKKEEALSQLSITDEMTGFFNRRAAFSILDKILHGTKRTEAPLTLCYADIDGLKKINDTYGHKEGDSYILSFVKAINQSLREEDYACRLGGDEFAFIFTKCDGAQAELIVQRVKMLLQKEQGKNNTSYPADFSYGLAQSSWQSGLDAEGLFELADKNMYIDKKNKRLGN